MEFFVDNWVWFLSGSIVMLMTLIGYIAEKTDFGRKDMPKMEKTKKEKKPKKEKKNKESKLEKKLDEVLDEPKAEVQMTLATDVILEEPTIQPENMIENLNISLEEAEELTPTEILENIEEPVENFNDLNVQKTINLDENYEDLNIPFGNTSFENSTNDIEEVIVSEPQEQFVYSNEEIPSIELPDLDTIASEETEDDVWKF